MTGVSGKVRKLALGLHVPHAAPGPAHGEASSFIPFDRNETPQRGAVLTVPLRPSPSSPHPAYHLAAQEGFGPKGLWTGW